MRIIGGKYRGKKLFSPQSASVRPTSDRTREALFNIMRSKLGNDFSGLNLIELFAGSGAFSLEAISQGFKSVTLVDIDISSALKNVKLFLQEQSNIAVVKGDACKLPYLKNKYEVMFMDAPYNQNLTSQALLEVSKYLNDNALCLIEVHKNELCKLPEKYHLLDERRYGLAKVIIAQFRA